MKGVNFVHAFHLQKKLFSPEHFTETQALTFHTFLYLAWLQQQAHL